MIRGREDGAWRMRPGAAHSPHLEGSDTNCASRACVPPPDFILPNLHTP